jgi:hypothetical protein
VDYWIDLFTGTTWDEYRKAGATVSGFQYRMRKTVSKIPQGDILLCYMTGVKRWVGALEVVGPSDDKRQIWSYDFPIRLSVKPLVVLDPEHGMPMNDLEGKVGFFRTAKDKGKYKGIVRRSPFKLDRADGDLIFQLLQNALKSPICRPVDSKMLSRKPFFSAERKEGKKSIQTVVSIPEPETINEGYNQQPCGHEEAGVTSHTEVQYHLLQVGSDMGFHVWVARNDRGKSFNKLPFSSIRNMVDELPTQFNEATNKTIELIDVLWLKGNSIVAAFEVECTTSIYSGLLRMSDLLALQPNLNIKLFIVAPEERRGKVEQEILRPTFMLRDPPLAKFCGFLPITRLMQKIEGARSLGLTSALKPDFLEQMADYYGSDVGNYPHQDSNLRPPV